ncbi:MAG: ABC transporter ATP-binding protein [Chloroflexi bacterium]|nr:MAG: ABC transporter ATP-binding protein [Chloroflexota bacterium]
MNTSLETASPAILVDNISVHYERTKNQASSIKEVLVHLLRKKPKSETIKALDGVSLDIKRGETYGVIGRNGSGKSTLLKALSKIIYPTTGRIQIWGKVTPLLGVGAGFHPDLTGRENIILYSTVLGRTAARTKELFDEIVEFAELEDFIEEPIRIYSSGMVARLGFAIAMAERPEILLVDEVLSVGDEKFAEKCKGKFDQFCSSGTTVVFISHNLGAVRDMCTRTSWLHKGKILQTGKTSDIIDEYKKFLWKR